MIGKIDRVKLREVWKHEALDFTTWLEQNIDVLNSSLDLKIVNIEREKNAGDFSVDLVGEDASGNVVVIENQLERSDHDHLGKLITYLTSLEAKIGIWIVSKPRPEHVKAVSWLNESSSASFYLVQVEAIKIGDSPPAPLLTLITGPSEEAVKAGDTKKKIAERFIIRKSFWSGLLEKAKQKTKLHASISAGQYHWIGTSAGLPFGLGLNYIVRRNDTSIELYIDSNKDNGEKNSNIFNKLLTNKDSIEKSFGGVLAWENMEGKRACRISKDIKMGGWQNKETWDDVYEATIDAMISLEKALRPFIKEI